jgi:DNA polymerase I
MASNRARKRLFLLDGTALAYRAHFAFIRNPLVNSKGIPTSGSFGFTNTLLKILRDEKPDYIAAAFDTSAPTFRHRAYTEYKATREKMPDDLAAEMPVIRDLVRAFRIPVLESPGFEADDVMGTVAVAAAERGADVFLVTGDKDMTQIVSPRIRMYSLSKGGGGTEAEITGPAEVEAKWGVKPDRIVDLFGLMGDASDNVPGVRGIGPKTARELIAEYGSIDGIYKKIDKIPRAAVREKLAAGRDMALLSRDLVTLRLDLDLSVGLDDLAVRPVDREKAVALFKELEFMRFLNAVIELDKGKPAADGAAAQAQAPAGRNYRIARSEPEIDALAVSLESVPMFSVDLETTSLHPMDAEIVGLSFSWREGEAWYVPVRLPGTHFSGDLFTSDKGADAGAALRRLKPVLENPAVRKCGQNIKYDMLVLRRHGVVLAGVDFDTMVAAYVINPSARAFGIDALALEYLNLEKIPTKSLIGTGAKQISMAEVELEKIAEYACEDAETAFRLRTLFEPRLKAASLEPLFHDVEMPLVGVLADLEENGVSLDSEFLGRMSRDMEKELEGIRSEILSIAGEAFNINSTQQLGRILFEKLKVHEAAGWKRPRKTKTGYATDVSVLEALSSHPLPKKLLDYRQLQKLKSTYVDALPALVNPRTGRLHASFNQTVAATGRLSSSDPNLQNIPVRTELGREIRKAFVPRDRAWSLLSADYNQIELRIMAHLSGDESLIGSFRNGEDVHRRTAAEVFGIAPGEVSDEKRRQAKTINFGVLYGMGAFGLAQRLGIPNDEAQRFITAYFARYPSVSEFIARTIAEAHRNGYVTTILNRRRYLPELRSDNRNLRDFAERTAVNTPIQGAAADLIKIAMIRIQERLKREGRKALMILQIHDELVFETPDAEIEGLTAMVREEMEGAIRLSVPVKADVGVGKNWFEAH